MTHPPYMRRYLRRLGLALGAYVLVLVAGKLALRALPGLPTPAIAAIALATALPICALFWAIFRLLAEADDEYQRLLLVRQVLLATAGTLAGCTVWQFLAAYDVIASGPEWIGVIWLALLGLAAPVVRWRA